MGQSVIVAIPIEWTLTSIARCLAAEEVLKSVSIRLFDDQLEILMSNEIDARVIIEEVSDSDPDADYDIKDELIADPLVSDQFRREIADLRILFARFNSIDLVRTVLHVLARNIVHDDGIGWIDTEHDLVISIRDFLARIDENPRWDWRTRTSA